MRESQYIKATIAAAALAITATTGYSQSWETLRQQQEQQQILQEMRWQELRQKQREEEMIEEMRAEAMRQQLELRNELGREIDELDLD
jgi:hypothetical protein